MNAVNRVGFGLGATLLLFFALFSIYDNTPAPESTIVGEISDVQYLGRERFTLITVIAENGDEYYLGAPGHDLDLGVGQKIKVTFNNINHLYHEFTRVVYADGTIEYTDVSGDIVWWREILRYKILKNM